MPMISYQNTAQRRDVDAEALETCAKKKQGSLQFEDGNTCQRSRGWGQDYPEGGDFIIHAL